MTMKIKEILHSQQDASVNFVYDWGAEARYVERDDYIIAYVSCATGCAQACRMCHLTQTKQVDETPLESFQLLQQVMDVLTHYRTKRDAGQVKHMEVMHINFMARGEPLNNTKLTYWLHADISAIQRIALTAGISRVVTNISTIMPQSDQLLGNLSRLTAPGSLRLYYSLYSMRPEFRKRWLPKAEDPRKALEFLRGWQESHMPWGSRHVVIHHALIEGENDSDEDAWEIVKALKETRLEARFNLVRYNPYSPVQGKEPPEERIQAYFDIMMRGAIIPGSRIVPRVGPDTKCSCGMFVELKKT